MYKTETIAGYECNSIFNREGTIRRSTAVLVGPDDEPGFRAKDGAAAKRARREAKRVVAEAARLPLRQVRVVARYSSLTVNAAGLVERRDAGGKVVGVYLP